VGETLMTMTFRGTSTRGLASESEPAVAVCILPGTELAFENDVKYDSRWFWTKTIRSRVAKFNALERHVPDRHHDAIEFADGTRVLVTQLREGQRVTVLQLPVTTKSAERKTETVKPGAETQVARTDTISTTTTATTPTRPISIP
jgi:hypothetical protein